MRKLLIILLMLMLAAVVNAKGTVNRIVLTGPIVDGELVIEDDEELLSALSMAGIEDFRRGALAEAPANPGDYVELERQFELQDRTGYVTFDRIQYYPDGDYVFYIGIDNGWSEYDRKWFHAVPQSAAMFEAYLHEHRVIGDESSMMQIVQSLFNRVVSLLAN